MKENRKQKTLKNVKTLAISAMLTALGVVIGTVCKTFFDFGGVFRITFENLPIIMAGILYGPIIGGLVAIAVDVISALVAGQGPLIFVMIGSMSVGIISGIVSKYIVRKKGVLQIISSAASAHIVGSMIIKPIALFSIYQWAVLFRIPIYLMIAPVEILLLCVLFKNKLFSRVVDY